MSFLPRSDDDPCHGDGVRLPLPGLDVDAPTRFQHHIVGLRLLRHLGHRQLGRGLLSVLGGAEGVRRADGSRGHVRQASVGYGGGGFRRGAGGGLRPERLRTQHVGQLRPAELRADELRQVRE